MKERDHPQGSEARVGPHRREWGLFATAMVHLYRGEVSRANTWRTRLDATTNWAVITAAAGLTFAFGSAQNPHFVLILVLLLTFIFLYIEARRYRYYLLWSYRVHLLETDFFAPLLVPPHRPASDWAAHLADSLLHPEFPLPLWEAVGRRFRRNYVWLATLLVVSWITKLALHPVPAAEWSTVLARAAVGPVKGPWILGAAGLVFAFPLVLGTATLAPQHWRDAIAAGLRALAGKVPRAAGPLMPEPQPSERLATIITSEGEALASRILTELRRGVTALEGRGMYTGETRDVLLCAVTDVQVPLLEEITRRTDPGAFVVVSPAEEVRGKGFRPFEAPS